MAVYKIFASSDATLYSRYPEQNTGLDEILEVACYNSDIPTAVIQSNSSDDIRRAIIKFDTSDIQKVYSIMSGSSSWASNLRLYLATATNLNTDYKLEVRQVSQSWDMGTGKFMDDPIIKNGVCWFTTYPYLSGSISDWNNPGYLNTIGGGSWTDIYVTQSFSYKSNKDLNVDVTPIVSSWISGSASNYGFIVKNPLLIEQNTGSFIGLSFFSVDTHTIYPPTLEFKWDDFSYSTGSLSVISNNSTIINIDNNNGSFKNDTEKYEFRVTARDKYPVRTFTTSSIYTVNKALPSSSYWAIEDVKTGERVIDFDDIYTKISCDSKGSYFSIYMNGLEPERYYKIIFKIILPTGENFDIDNNIIFKLIR